MWDGTKLVQLLASTVGGQSGGGGGGSGGGGGGGGLSAEEVYTALVPLRRWRAHATAVVSIELASPAGRGGPDSDSDETAAAELLISASRDADLRLWRCGDPPGASGSSDPSDPSDPPDPPDPSVPSDPSGSSDPSELERFSCVGRFG